MQKVPQSASALATGCLLWLVPSPWRRDKGSQVGAPYPAPTWPMEDPLNCEPFALLCKSNSEWLLPRRVDWLSVRWHAQQRPRAFLPESVSWEDDASLWQAACVFLSKWALIICQWGYLAHPLTNLATLAVYRCKFVFVRFHLSLGRWHLMKHRKANLWIFPQWMEMICVTRK